MTEKTEYKVLVTGHTGFIGSNLYDYLLTVPDVEAIGYSKSKGQNIFDTANLMMYVSEADIVYHLAADANLGASKKRPVYTINVNIDGCLNVLEACRICDTPMVYASTCEVYGTSKLPFSEGAGLNPTNPYAASKAASDRICYSYAVCYGMDVKIVRLFNPYGPRQQLNKIIPTFYDQAKNGKEITVHGVGFDTRDYVYIDDIISGLWMARGIPAGETINLATGVETTTVEVAKLIQEITKNNTNLKFCEYPPEHGNIKNQVGTNYRAISYGWKPQVKLEEGIKRTVELLEGKKEK